MFRLQIQSIFRGIQAICVICLICSVSLEKATPQEAAQSPAKSEKSPGKDNPSDLGKSHQKKAKKPPKPFQWVNEPGEKHPEMVKHRTFRSQSLGVDVGYCILLPPNYFKNKHRRYPVVYYLHGGRPGSELKSVALGPKIREIMKNEQVTHMIYVFSNGGPVSHYNMPDNPKAQGADVFIKELIPHIDAKYRTISSREGRGIEGFSQGGRGTMRLSLRHPELFCSAAAGGGGYATEKMISENNGYENPKLRFAKGDNVWDLARWYVASDSPKVSWMIYVGTDGTNYDNNLEYMKFLESIELEHQSLIIPDVPHSGSKAYDAAAEKIMQFHAQNFTREGTINLLDAPRNLEQKR